MSTFITTFFITGIVRGQDSNDFYSNEMYYHELEQQYRKEIISVLNTNGYQNAGIMITCVINEDQIRNYQIKINHNRFINSNEEMKENIREQILEKSFNDEESKFNIIFNN